MSDPSDQTGYGRRTHWNLKTSELAQRPRYAVKEVGGRYWLCEEMNDWQGVRVQRPVYEMNPAFNPGDLADLEAKLAAARQEAANAWKIINGQADDALKSREAIAREAHQQMCKVNDQLEARLAAAERELDEARESLGAVTQYGSDLQRRYDELRFLGKEVLVIYERGYPESSYAACVMNDLRAALKREPNKARERLDDQAEPIKE